MASDYIINMKEKDFNKLIKLADAVEIPYIIPSRGSIKSKYLPVPSIGLAVRRDKILFSNNFYECQEKLHKNNEKMLTPYEFTEFLKEARKQYIVLYKKITDVKSPYRAEWLDADFKVEGKDLVVYYHIFENGKIVKKSKKLDKNTLMSDKTPGISIDDWLENSTKQGFPTNETKSGNLYYWFPRHDNNSVVRFSADDDGAFLNCGRYPTDRDADLGVRVARLL